MSLICMKSATTKNIIPETKINAIIISYLRIQNHYQLSLVLQDYDRDFSNTVFTETGTYYANLFNKVPTIFNLT